MRYGRSLTFLGSSSLLVLVLVEPGGLAFQGAFGDQVTNKGTWTTSDISDFGASADTLTNEISGTIRVRGKTQFDTLEVFTSKAR